jgi:hypothetical protein
LDVLQKKFLKPNFKIEETIGKLIESFPQCKRFYFLEETQILQGDQFIHLPGVKDDYLSTSFKQWFGLDFIYRHENPKFIMCIYKNRHLCSSPQRFRIIVQI